jgi:hypothetical protein
MNIIRMSARIIGTLIVAFVMIFAIGNFIEGLHKSGPGLNNYNIITFVILGIGLAGLIFAWWKEGRGGLISLLSFMAFNVLAAVNPTPGSSYTFILLFFLLPSILFLLYWWLERDMSKKSQKIESK